MPFYHFSLKEKRERGVMKLLSWTVNLRFLCGLIMKAQKSAVTDASFRRWAPLLWRWHAAGCSKHPNCSLESVKSFCCTAHLHCFPPQNVLNSHFFRSATESSAYVEPLLKAWATLRPSPCSRTRQERYSCRSPINVFSHLLCFYQINRQISCSLCRILPFISVQSVQLSTDETKGGGHRLWSTIKRPHPALPSCYQSLSGQ